MEVEEHALELSEQVVGPLVLGGPVQPIRPLGAELAVTLGTERRIADDELRSRIEHARVRQARRIVALDVLPDLDAAEWTMVAALNDLLQVTNEELSSFATRSRHSELLGATLGLCRELPPPAHLNAAVARHGTFRNLLDLTRVDTHLSWWTGSAVFRGQPAPSRLLRWPQLRRVRTDQRTVRLAEMAEWAPVDANEYLYALALLVAASPLTDLATVGRAAPPFLWTRHTLSVVATHPGCNLALRAFAQQEPSTSMWLRSCAQLGAAGLQALQQATARLPQQSVAQKVAAGYVESFAAAVQHWTAPASAA